MGKTNRQRACAWLQAFVLGLWIFKATAATAKPADAVGLVDRPASAVLLAQNLNPSQQDLEDELDDELSPSDGTGGVEILDLNELEDNLSPDFEAELDEDALGDEVGGEDADGLDTSDDDAAGGDALSGGGDLDAVGGSDAQLEQELDQDGEVGLDDELETVDANDTAADSTADLEAELDAAPDEAPAQNNFISDSAAAEAPDYAYESKIYRIYRNFLSTPVSPDEWESMTNERGTETYSVQQGDTLWDISQTFFGDGHYWPKVWSLNGAIFNPHRIDAETNLTFIMGSESEPPSVAVGAPAQNNVNALLENESTREQDASFAESLSPIVGPSGMLRKLPPSLPDYSLRPVREEKKLQITAPPEWLKKIDREVVVSQYIASRMPSTVGQVKETQNGGRWASQGEYVFVHFRDPSVKVGDRFLAIVDKGRNLKSTAALRGSMGRTIEVQGELELIEKLPRRRSFRARVVHTLYPIEVGAKLQKSSITVQKVDLHGPRGPVRGQVIGGQYAKRRFFFGLGDVLYINRGTARGLQEGHVLEVQPNRGVRYRGSRLSRETRSIGSVQVIKSTPRFATAVVVKLQAAIHTGDYVAPAQ